MRTKVKYKIGSDEPELSVNVFGDPAGAGATGAVSVPFVIDLRRSELPATDLLTGNSASAPDVVAPTANNVSHDAAAVEPVRVTSIRVDVVPKEMPASDPGFDPVPGGAMPAPGTVQAGRVETPAGMWVRVEGSAGETQKPVPLDVGLEVSDVPQVGLPLVTMVDGWSGPCLWPVLYDGMDAPIVFVCKLPLPEGLDPVVPTPVPDPTGGTPGGYDSPVGPEVFANPDPDMAIMGGGDLWGKGGNDTLFGSGGADYLKGFDGNDTLVGGNGDDWLWGGSGADVFSFAFGESGIDNIYDFRVGVDKIQLAGFGYSSFADIQLISILNTSKHVSVNPGVSWGDSYACIVLSADARIYLAAVDVSLLSAADFVFVDGDGLGSRTDGPGDPKVSTLSPDGKAVIPVDYDVLDFIAGSGPDTVVTGSETFETLLGTDGRDVLIGKGGNDNLRGGDGNDTLTGGNGADWSWGGSGADVFWFAAGESGIDRIYDFRAGEDKIQLVGFGFSSFADINLTWSFSGGLSVIDGKPLGDTLAIVLDSDVRIELVGVDGLSAADFMFG